MSAIRLAAIAVALACAGCKTVIIRPTMALECALPVQFQNKCVATAALAQQVTYGDLPDVALRARQDFVECRKSYVALLESYEFCTGQLNLFNEKLKKLEDDVKGKYKDAEVREN